jgi:hypothetical protein
MNGMFLPSMPAAFRPYEAAALRNLPRVDPGLMLAQRTRRRMNRLRCSGTTGTWTECMFNNGADYSAFNTSASEGSLLGGVNDQPVIPALFFFNRQGKQRGISLLARGVLSTTSTPTIIFQWRLGTTLGSSFLSGTSVGVSPTITTSSGVTNKWWESRLDLTCYTPGLGSGNTTLSGSGYVASPGGFASPFQYALEPTTPDTATWTATIDASLTYYVNLSVTWGTSSSSNTITLKTLQLLGLN